MVVCHNRTTNIKIFMLSPINHTGWGPEDAPFVHSACCSSQFSCFMGILAEDGRLELGNRVAGRLGGLDEMRPSERGAALLKEFCAGFIYFMRPTVSRKLESALCFSNKPKVV